MGSVASHKVYYKGEGGGFPQVWAVMSLVCLCCLWFILAPRVFQLCTNHFVWVVWKPVWVSEACQLFLVPSRNSNTPLYPSKCCELGIVPQLLPLPLSFTWTHIWILQGVGSASICVTRWNTLYIWTRQQVLSCLVTRTSAKYIIEITQWNRRAFCFIHYYEEDFLCWLLVANHEWKCSWILSNIWFVPTST